jgi:hypothetical protein
LKLTSPGPHVPHSIAFLTQFGTLDKCSCRNTGGWLEHELGVVWVRSENPLLLVEEDDDTRPVRAVPLSSEGRALRDPPLLLLLLLRALDIFVSGSLLLRVTDNFLRTSSQDEFVCSDSSLSVYSGVAFCLIVFESSLSSSRDDLCAFSVAFPEFRSEGAVLCGHTGRGTQWSTLPSGMGLSVTALVRRV